MLGYRISQRLDSKKTMGVCRKTKKWFVNEACGFYHANHAVSKEEPWIKISFV
jgi:hypothetical protein